jgi:hypothetical protein
MRALYHDYLDTLRKMMAVEKPTSAARKNLPALIISILWSGKVWK